MYGFNSFDCLKFILRCTDELLGVNFPKTIWAIYNDLSRGHPKWWFSKGIPTKLALNQIKDL